MCDWYITVSLDRYLVKVYSSHHCNQNPWITVDKVIVVVVVVVVVV